ncbi:aminoglycoside phosphotransferase family protein [Paenibacillus chitinolyticus]|uniref:aminoglycoside phosphotransferase family protein n=1 Tax=Paenibacillus chitinolyticus TaxID=79263 RepID=UPI00367228F1
MYLFKTEINGWDSWGKLYQTISTFEPLIKSIFVKEKLPFTKIEHCTPGTNAVFKVGDYVIKIFAPKESGIDSTADFETESFAIHRANTLGVSVPKLLASGFIQDKYRFSYMIMDYINGTEINKLNKNLTYEEKVTIGHRLRLITDAINTPCGSFNGIDVIRDKDRQNRWEKYSEHFRKERLNYIHSHDFGEKVFVHGDLNGDNLLLTHDQKLYIIDFAEAVLAPAVYEHALIACELFRFDKAFMTGYFGDYNMDEITELVFNGILIHDFGGDVIEQHVGQLSEFDSLKKLRERLYLSIKYNQTKPI